MLRKKAFSLKLQQTYFAQYEGLIWLQAITDCFETAKQ